MLFPVNRILFNQEYRFSHISTLSLREPDPGVCLILLSTVKWQILAHLQWSTVLAGWIRCFWAFATLGSLPSPGECEHGAFCQQTQYVCMGTVVVLCAGWLPRA